MTDRSTCTRTGWPDAPEDHLRCGCAVCEDYLRDNYRAIDDAGQTGVQRDLRAFANEEA